VSSYRAPMRSRLSSVVPVLAVERGLSLGLVGMGGRLRSVPRTIAEAAEMTADEYDDRAARRLERFAAVADGSEVWTRDGDGLFHRGDVTGPWTYDTSQAAYDADLVHVRPCSWDTTALEEHRVPSAVAATFRRGGRNFQRIRQL
jgi:hypothetical protein